MDGGPRLDGDRPGSCGETAVSFGTLLYFVRRGENESLRYSFRTLSNMPHDRIVIVGHAPGWVRDIEVIRGNKHASKWLNVFGNLRIASRELAGETVVVMNDDFFITHPMTELPSWHRGPLAEHLGPMRSSAWRHSLVATLDFFIDHGVTDPLSYEAHIPVEMEADKLGVVLDLAAEWSTHRKGRVRDLPQWRTLYGNWWDVPAVRRADVKLNSAESDWDPSAGIVSTNARTFRDHPVLRNVRATFTQPSPYER